MPGGAGAVTVWAAKGLRYPIVYLPFAFNRNIWERDLILYHEDSVRCLHIGGKDSRITTRSAPRAEAKAPATTAASPTSR